MLPVTTVHFFLLFFPKGTFPLWILVLDGLHDIDHLKYHFLINAFSKILIRCELHNFLKIATRSHYFMVCNSTEKSHVCWNKVLVPISLIWQFGAVREKEKGRERRREEGKEGRGEEEEREREGRREKRGKRGNKKGIDLEWEDLV